MRDTDPRSAWIRARLDRVHKIPIEAVLALLGFDVRADNTETHQTFSCTLHGRDSRPSGRTYPGSDSWYCWGCSRSRDAVATVREKQGLGFEPAIRWLEGAFNLPPLPMPRSAGPAEAPEQEDEDPAADDPLDALERATTLAAQDRKIPLELALLCWEVVDRGRSDEKFRPTALGAASKLRARIQAGG